MDQARGHLLAGAGFTLEHDGGTAGRDLTNQGQLLEAGGTLGDVPIGEARDGLADDTAKRRPPSGYSTGAEHTSDQSGKLSRTMRLDEIAERALRHRLSARRIALDQDDERPTRTAGRGNGGKTEGGRASEIEIDHDRVEGA